MLLQVLAYSLCTQLIVLSLGEHLAFMHIAGVRDCTIVPIAENHFRFACTGEDESAHGGDGRK